MSFKTILIITDFSEDTKASLNYAIKTASKLKGRIILFHPFQIPTLDLSLKNGSRKNTTFKTETNKLLHSLCIKVETSSNNLCEYINKERVSDEIILETIRKKKIGLVFLLVRDEVGIKKTLLGNTTSTIIEKAYCPVIAVPLKIIHKKIKKITFASNYLATDLFLLEQLVEIAKVFEAKIEILHISDYEFTTLSEKEYMNIFSAKIKDNIGYDKISFQLVYSTNIESRLKSYVNNKETDLLVLSHRKRGPLESLIWQSTTVKLTHQSKIPLMAFHHTEESLLKVDL